MLTGPEWEDGNGKKERYGWALAVDIMANACVEGYVQNVYAQSKKMPDDSFQRINGTFTVHLAFSLRALESYSAVKDIIENVSRRTSGLPCRAGQNVDIMGRNGAKFLMYMDKTEEERKRKKGKKGDGKKGDGKCKKGGGG